MTPSAPAAGTGASPGGGSVRAATGTKLVCKGRATTRGSVTIRGNSNRDFLSESGFEAGLARMVGRDGVKEGWMKKAPSRHTALRCSVPHREGPMQCVLALVLTSLLLAGGPVARSTQAETTAQTLRADFLKVVDRPRVPPAPSPAKLRAENGYRQELLSFASESDQRVPLLILRKGEPRDRQAIAIVLHGTGGSKEGTRAPGSGHCAHGRTEDVRVPSSHRAIFSVMRCCEVTSSDGVDKGGGSGLTIH